MVTLIFRLLGLVIIITIIALWISAMIAPTMPDSWDEDQAGLSLARIAAGNVMMIIPFSESRDRAAKVVRFVISREIIQSNEVVCLIDR